LIQPQSISLITLHRMILGSSLLFCKLSFSQLLIGSAVLLFLLLSSHNSTHGY